MSQASSELPKFEDPPVVETVLGVGFRPLKWQALHFGLFWDQIRADYPHFEAKPFLGGAPAQGESGRVVFRMPTLDLRYWFLEGTKSRLLQVQRDRFIHNWRKIPEGGSYPHYDPVIRPAFEKEWNRFVGFLDDVGLGQPEFGECEVTYVNQFEKGREWENPEQLTQVLRFLQWSDGGVLPPIRTKKCSFFFEVPEVQGRLEIELAPGIRNHDLKEIYQLNLSARGMPDDMTTDGLMDWLDRGRACVVRGFTDLTTPAMHKLWGRIR